MGKGRGGRLTAIDGVYGGAGDEESFERGNAMNSVEAERHIKEDGESVLPAIDKMRKGVASIVVTSQTLHGAPDSWKGGKEA